jgi:N-methylhydantoinase B
MAEAIRRFPKGPIVRHAYHDPVPGLPDGVTIKIGLSVDPVAGSIEVDLRDNIDCQPCGLNLTEATARTAAMMGIFSGLGDVVPPNAGSFRRLTVHLRENCIVGIPRHPVSCSAATTDLSESTASGVVSALAELAEGFGLAEIGRAQPISMGVISGNDPRAGGAPYVNQLVLAVTGGPGGPVADGWLTILGIGAAGFLMRDSVEIDEMKYPILVHEQRIIPDSEGAGRRRGSPGAYVEYGPVSDAPMQVVYLSDGTYNPARGVRGGQDGAPAQQRKRFRDRTPSDELGSYAHVVLEEGETIISVSCGGGGYGPPQHREPERVLKDVLEGWISHERARDIYRVAITADGTIDNDATAALRT